MIAELLLEPIGSRRSRHARMQASASSPAWLVRYSAFAPAKDVVEAWLDGLGAEGRADAEANPDEAAMIVLENDETGAQTEAHQKRMMGEIAKLTAGSNGALDPADYDRTVAALMSGGSDPVITKAPEGAWSHAITDAALQ